MGATLKHTNQTFRDNYNSEGLFSCLSGTLNKEISWWIYSDREEWFNPLTKTDAYQEMTLKGATEFHQELTELLIEMTSTKTWRLGYNSGRILSTEEKEQYQRKLLELIIFIAKALRHKKPIIWSV